MGFDSDILSAIRRSTDKDLAISLRDLLARKGWGVDIIELKREMPLLRCLYPQIKGFYRKIGDGKQTISEEMVYWWDDTAGREAG